MSNVILTLTSNILRHGRSSWTFMDKENDDSCKLCTPCMRRWRWIWSCKKPSLFFDFILISTPAWMTEKELEREIKKKETKKKEKKCMKIFVAEVSKWETASSGYGSDNEREWKNGKEPNSLLATFSLLPSSSWLRLCCLFSAEMSLLYSTRANKSVSIECKHSEFVSVS